MAIRDICMYMRDQRICIEKQQLNVRFYCIDLMNNLQMLFFAQINFRRSCLGFRTIFHPLGVHEWLFVIWNRRNSVRNPFESRNPEHETLNLFFLFKHYYRYDPAIWFKPGTSQKIN